MSNGNPALSGMLSKGAEETPEPEPQPPPPPYRSGPWPSRINPVMTASGLALEVRLPANVVRELEEAAGDSEIAIHVVADDDEEQTA